MKISVVFMAFILLGFLFCLVCSFGFWLVGRRKGYWFSSNILIKGSKVDDVTLFKDKDGFKVNSTLFNRSREEHDMDGSSIGSYSGESSSPQVEISVPTSQMKPVAQRSTKKTPMND
eukprot:UN04352